MAKKPKTQKPRHPLTQQRLKNQFMNLVTNPFNIIVMITLVLLFCLIIIPLISMIKTTLGVGASELVTFRRFDPTIEEGDFTLYYWKYLLTGNLTKTLLWEPLIHSLTIGISVTLISCPLGALLAWMMVRTDMPAKGLLSNLILIPYMVPSWCKSLAWLSVFRNSTSGSTGLLTGMGIPVPDWLAYGPTAIIIVMCMHYYAFAYLTVSGALRSVNSELEEMAAIQGATRTQILKSITLPLVLPSFLSAAIMTFSKSLGTYGVAARLGKTINYFVLATRMKECLSDGTHPKTVGFTMAILMILLAVVIVFGNQKMIGTRKSYATIGGKGTRSNPMRLGVYKYPLLALLVVFLIVAMFAPLFVLVMESFQINPGRGYGLDNLTLYAWIGQLENAPSEKFAQNGLFYNPAFLKACWNTAKLAILGSIITAGFGLFFGYVVTRGRGKWYGNLTEQLIFIPYLMPGVAFSAIYLAMFGVPRLGGLIPSLYNTFALILIVSVVKHFPFASRSGQANMMQISTELEEAATINGASFWGRIFKIVLPLAKNGFISGLMLSFISIAKELDLLALIMSEENRTLSFLSFEYSKEAMPQVADAICIIIIIFILVCNRIAERMGGSVSKSM